MQNVTGLDSNRLYWEPKNPGRIACGKHVGWSASPEDVVSAEDIEFFEAAGDPAKCEDC